MQLQPIQDVDGFKKDESTGAVLAIDKNALIAYKKKRQQHHSILNDISELKEELSEIREMLKMIISTNSK
jgi:hypothetical protein